MFTLTQERSSDAAKIEKLYEAAFGPGRHARTAERLREGNQPVAELCFVAEEDGALAGSVRFWPISAGKIPGLMLGPLAVQPHRRRNGMGLALVQAGLARAREAGAPFAILVGDEPYYGRGGFKIAEKSRFQMPGPVPTDRLLCLHLAPLGVNACGLVKPAPEFVDLAAFAPPGTQKQAAYE